MKQKVGNESIHDVLERMLLVFSPKYGLANSLIIEEMVHKKIKRLKNWNPVQLKIIEKIISQLRENSYLTEEDFKIGIFKDNFGGYNKINQKLEDKLGDIVSIINEEIILN